MGHNDGFIYGLDVVARAGWMSRDSVGHNRPICLGIVRGGCRIEMPLAVRVCVGRL